MITILKVAVLLLCTAVSFIISCCSEKKKGTCVLLSFFVAAGITSFFSEEALSLSIFCAAGVFLLLSVLSILLSHKTMHRKH